MPKSGIFTNGCLAVDIWNNDSPVPWAPPSWEIAALSHSSEARGSSFRLLARGRGSSRPVRVLPRVSELCSSAGRSGDLEAGRGVFISAHT